MLEYDDLDSVQLNSIRRQFEVNALGPLHVVLALRQQLHPGAKVVFITSKMASFGEHKSGGVVRI